MPRRFTDWGGNIIAFLLVITCNVLSNAIPLNGQTMSEISAKLPSLFTPAGFTFAIWGLIYLALSIFVIYQALPPQRSRQSIADIGGFFKLNCVANAAWIIAWHYDLLLLSLFIMAVILATLIAIYRSLGLVDSGVSLRDRLALQLPFSLYTGWISVATIANISAVQTGMGWDNWLLDPVTWTQLKIAFAGAIGAMVMLRRSDIVFMGVIVWAAYGIATEHAATPAVAGAATTLCQLGLILIILTLSFGSNRQPAQSS